MERSQEDEAENEMVEMRRRSRGRLIMDETIGELMDGMCTRSRDAINTGMSTRSRGGHMTGTRGGHMARRCTRSRHALMAEERAKHMRQRKRRKEKALTSAPTSPSPISSSSSSSSSEHGDSSSSRIGECCHPPWGCTTPESERGREIGEEKIN